VDAVTNILLASMSAQNHGGVNTPSTDILSLDVCDGRELRFEWVSGSWDDECSYTITAADGTVVLSGSGAMSAPFTYMVSCGVGQMTELSEGWNYFSTYIVIEDPEEGMLMLQEALGENGLTIQSVDDYTTYEDGEWGAMGDLTELDNTQMYMILVSGDCEVQLQGTPCNPGDYTITIVPGWNYIGFPSAEVISIEDAFADFEAEDGDMILSVDDYTTFEDGWGAMGDLEEMTPGQGYMYYSASDEDKDLVIQTGMKQK
jgi:hypothetical protein